MSDNGQERANLMAKFATKVMLTPCEGGCAMPATPTMPQSGERRLARTLVEDAIDESLSGPSRTREDARTWLRDNLRLMSARTCFEAIGIDYDAALAKLEAKWKAQC